MCAHQHSRARVHKGLRLQRGDLLGQREAALQGGCGVLRALCCAAVLPRRAPQRLHLLCLLLCMPPDLHSLQQPISLRVLISALHQAGTRSGGSSLGCRCFWCRHWNPAVALVWHSSRACCTRGGFSASSGLLEPIPQPHLWGMVPHKTPARACLPAGNCSHLDLSDTQTALWTRLHDRWAVQEGSAPTQTDDMHLQCHKLWARACHLAESMQQLVPVLSLGAQPPLGVNCCSEAALQCLGSDISRRTCNLPVWLSLHCPCAGLLGNCGQLGSLAAPACGVLQAICRFCPLDPLR